MLLRYFRVKLRYNEAKTVKVVRFVRPPPSWTKVNIDGVACGQPGEASHGGIFRMSRGFVKGSFATPLGVQTAIYVEVMGFIVVVELATLKGWFPLWIDKDCKMLVAKVNSKSNDVTWRIRVRWTKCLTTLSGNMFSITHVYREGNIVADRMATIGLVLSIFTWRFQVPDIAFDVYRRNLTVVTEFRISG